CPANNSRVDRLAVRGESVLCVDEAIHRSVGRGYHSNGQLRNGGSSATRDHVDQWRSCTDLPGKEGEVPTYSGRQKSKTRLGALMRPTANSFQVVLSDSIMSVVFAQRCDYPIFLTTP